MNTEKLEKTIELTEAEKELKKVENKGLELKKTMWDMLAEKSVVITAIICAALVIIAMTINFRCIR